MRHPDNFPIREPPERSGGGGWEGCAGLSMNQGAGSKRDQGGPAPEGPEGVGRGEAGKFA